MGIIVNLDVMMAKRKKSLTAKAVRFTTLEAICRELNCQPGDLLEYVPDESKNEDESEDGRNGV